METHYYLYILLIIILIIIFRKIISNRENMKFKLNYDIDKNLLFSDEPYKLKKIQKLCNSPGK